MADNISLNKSSIDLTNNKQESIIVENISSSTANVTLTNSVSGVEWSDDAGQNWNTGNDSFVLAAGNKGYQVGGSNNDRYTYPIVIGDFIYSSFITTSNPFDGETTGTGSFVGITKRNKTDYSKVWTNVLSVDSTKIVLKTNPSDNKLWAYYQYSTTTLRLERYDLDGNVEKSYTISATLSSETPHDMSFDGTDYIFITGRGPDFSNKGFVKKIDYNTGSEAWQYVESNKYIFTCYFNPSNNKLYIAISDTAANSIELKSLNTSGSTVDSKVYSGLGYALYVFGIYVDSLENIYTHGGNYSTFSVFRKDTFTSNQFVREIQNTNAYGGYFDIANETAYLTADIKNASISFSNILNWEVDRPALINGTVGTEEGFVDEGVIYIADSTTGNFGATNQGGEDAVIYKLSTTDGSLKYIEGGAKDYLFKYLPSSTTFSIPSEVSFSSTNTETVYCDVKPINDFGNVIKGDTSSSFTLRIENIDTITRTVSSIVAPTGFEVKKSSESIWSSSIQSFDITSSSYEDIDFRSNTSQIGDISESATLSYNPTISIGLSLSSLPSDFKVEYIDSHVDNAKGRLIRQYRQGSNVEDICGALVGPLQTSEDDLFGLYSMLDIDTMTGVNLDRIGGIIGQNRNGYNDENYRTFLKARVKINNSTGTIDEIVELWNLFNPGETIEVREQFPAQIELLTTAERPSTDIENAIYNLMYESKQAGVRLVWIIPYTVEGDGIFKFDSTNSADQFDSGVFNRILHD